MVKRRGDRVNWNTPRKTILSFLIFLIPSCLVTQPSLAKTKTDAHYTIGALTEVGGVYAPKRTLSEQERIPWRSREIHGLYPARMTALFKIDQEAWQGSSRIRLYAQPLWLDSPLEASYSDPLGTDPALSELWFAYRFRPTKAFTFKVGAGRWVPNIDQSLNPRSLAQREFLWSRAPDPRDRTVSGIFFDLQQNSLSAWLPRLIKISTFMPSLKIKPQKEEQDLGLHTQIQWQRRLGHYLTDLSFEGGYLHRGRTWGGIGYQFAYVPKHHSSNTQVSHGWQYRGSFLYRMNPEVVSTQLQASDASIGKFGNGLVATHQLLYQFWKLRFGVEYEWRDPQIDFAYNAQHVLSLSCHVIVYTQVNVSLEHRHLWSANDHRFSFGSDLTFAQLSWSPTWNF